jgi:hypothetical protein
MRRIGRARKARLLRRLAAGAGQIVEEALLGFALRMTDCLRGHHGTIGERLECDLAAAVRNAIARGAIGFDGRRQPPT